MSIFDIDRFVPEEDPIDSLPELYKPWEDIVSQLPQLLKDFKLRDTVANLPTLPVSSKLLPTEGHWRRAYCLVTFISQGYLWERGEEGVVDMIPSQLAIPWIDLSSHCGLPPVTTYAATVLWNWKVINPALPPSLDNMRTLFSYTGTRAEEWFYIIHISIELAAAPGIKSANECYAAIFEKNDEKVTECLEAVAESIREMVKLAKRMREECSPENFSNYIGIWHEVCENNALSGRGLKYEKGFIRRFEDETFREEYRNIRGASGMQSSTMPAFDILLGVKHSGRSQGFYSMQRWHMPREHRQYLLEKSQLKSARDYVLERRSNVKMVDAYNACITEVVNFRSYHVVLVTSFVINQMPNDDQPHPATQSIMNFLKGVRDHAIEHKVHQL